MLVRTATRRLHRLVLTTFGVGSLTLFSAREGGVLAGGKATELAREQDYLAALYDRLDLLRHQTHDRLAEGRRRGASGPPQQRSERDAFAGVYEARLAPLNAVGAGLCLGPSGPRARGRPHVG